MVLTRAAARRAASALVETVATPPPNMPVQRAPARKIGQQRLGLGVTEAGKAPSATKAPSAITAVVVGEELDTNDYIALKHGNTAVEDSITVQEKDTRAQEKDRPDLRLESQDLSAEDNASVANPPSSPELATQPLLTPATSISIEDGPAIDASEEKADASPFSALDVTHASGEASDQKENADSTGGDDITPPAAPEADESVSGSNKRRRSPRLAVRVKQEDDTQQDEPLSKRRRTVRIRIKTVSMPVSTVSASADGEDVTEQAVIADEIKAEARTSEVGTSIESIQAGPTFIYRRIAHARSHKVFLFTGAALKKGVAIKVADTITAAHIPNIEFKQQKPKGSGKGNGKAQKLTPGYTPYPYRQVPSPEACEEVHRILTAMHGEQKQPDHLPAPSLEVAGCGEVPSLLDGLLRTVISGSTTMGGANKVIKNLADHYGILQGGIGAGSINWEKIRLSSVEELEGVMRVGGLAPKKSQFIKTILNMVHNENVAREERAGTKKQKPATRRGAARKARAQSTAGADEALHHRLSLEHMHEMTKDDAMVALVQFPGVAIKTAACVTLFRLRYPCLAVDTHVHRFCCWLGWTPERIDPDTCYNHVDFMVPDHLKYALHQLFIKHGQECFKCRAATKPGTAAWKKAPDCPLEHLLDRSRVHDTGRRPRIIQKDDDEEEEQEEDEGNEAEGKEENDNDAVADTEQKDSNDEIESKEEIGSGEDTEEGSNGSEKGGDGDEEDGDDGQKDGDIKMADTE